MVRFILLGCMITFVTAKSTNWDNFRFPFRHTSVKNNFHRKHEIENNETEKNYSVCRSQGCFKVASEFWESMNKSVNPCDDFYEYACGNWAKNNPIPPAEMEWDNIRKMTKEVEYKIRDFLDEDIESNDLLPIKQVKKFYKSCMNDDELEKMGLKPLEAIIFRNGGWPIIMESGEWFEENIPWQQIDDFYSRLTRSSFYSFDITKNINEIKSFQDLKTMNSSVIELKLPELPPVIELANGMKFDRKKMYDDGSYGKLIKEIVLAFIEARNAHVSEEKLDEDIEDLINFEKKLGTMSEITSGSTSIRSLEYVSNICNIHKRPESLSKQINWIKSIKNLFFEANIELSGKEKFSITAQMKKYLKNLCNILSETKPRTIVNYIHWNFLSQMLPHTTSKMRELFYEFKKHLTGVKIQKPRWETCSRNIKMEHAMAYHFVRKYFKENMKDDGMKMFRNIQKAMIKQILRSDWLSDNMKKVEIDKIKSAGTIFGYPNWYDNHTEFVNYYSGLPIGHQYLDNVLLYKKYLLKKNLRKLLNPELVIEWFPTLVNAAYNVLYNELVLPAGLFQYPFYSPSQPETINYGGLGTIMGHEIAHAFDAQGLLIDKNGNDLDWSANAEKLEETMSCFLSQYGKFYQVEENSPLMGDREKTLAEDMADSLGVDVVFEAFEEMEKEKNEPRLPGFEDLSNEQIFFLSFAKIWCTSVTPEYEELVKKDDVHSTSRYRVTSTVQNSKGFSEAFNCQTGSKMNPEEKCRLWRK